MMGSFSDPNHTHSRAFHTGVAPPPPDPPVPRRPLLSGGVHPKVTSKGGAVGTAGGRGLGRKFVFFFVFFW